MSPTIKKNKEANSTYSSEATTELAVRENEAASKEHKSPTATYGNEKEDIGASDGKQGTPSKAEDDPVEELGDEGIKDEGEKSDAKVETDVKSKNTVDSKMSKINLDSPGSGEAETTKLTLKSNESPASMKTINSNSAVNSKVSTSLDSNKIPAGWRGKNNLERGKKTSSETSKKEDWKAAFDWFDEEGKGKISIQDLNRILNEFEINPSDNQLRLILYDLDLDNSGYIDFDEFHYAMQCFTSKKTAYEEINEAFRMFDRDNDGCISAWELKKVLTILGEQVSSEQADAMIKEADTDGDGVVNYDEFVHALVNLNKT